MCSYSLLQLLMMQSTVCNNEQYSGHFIKFVLDSKLLTKKEILDIATFKSPVKNVYNFIEAINSYEDNFMEAKHSFEKQVI